MRLQHCPYMLVTGPEYRAPVEGATYLISASAAVWMRYASSPRTTIRTFSTVDLSVVYAAISATAMVAARFIGKPYAPVEMAGKAMVRSSYG